MEVYCALYDQDLNSIVSPGAVIVNQNFFEAKKNTIYFFGDGAAKCKEILPGHFIYAENIFPSARFMGKLALRNFGLKRFENVSLAEPVYLKEFQPGQKKNTET
jgi:tRNA threonylcarbamoyladenosine biosynthesis protein TsaB